jgi:ferric-dicitrate binding protein FerR (iron transport regulator)
MDDELLYRRLIGQAKAEERTAVDAWRRASIANEERYRDLERVLNIVAADEASRQPGPPPSVADVLRRAHVPASSGASSRRNRWPSWIKLPLAAAAVAVLTFLATGGARLLLERHSGFGADEIVASASGPTTVELVDGTVVRLAPKSRLRLRPDSGGRFVALEGRAYFAVAKKGGAPFRIRTAAGVVTVTGTRFDLDADRQNLRLIVVEGRVVLSTSRTQTEVTAGQVMRVVEGTAAPVASVSELGPLVDWVGNFMAFQATPLREVAREIETRFPVRVVIPDSALADRTITAWFADLSLEKVLEVVCVVASARCSVDGEVVTMKLRND